MSNQQKVIEPVLKRICIYPKDIMVITGKSYRQSLRVYHKIKQHMNKTEDQHVTTSDVAKFLGLNLEKLEKVIR
ncbi:hypothetical protein [Sphingobacterium sp. BN32]|uniref:hypothetical protein n=1 Tax=Sphingobacterium sp. BN32 TaxID=3058432 RepID=UPI00265D23A6|nr:hypothetical protein [Sphingobacterium sp. BN32]WKK60199.1 hypothetical protein QYC40_08115 [Sphingobacterium sp. BN32]